MMRVEFKSILFDRDRTCSLRGLCMLMIVLGHVSSSVTGPFNRTILDHLFMYDWGTLGTGVFLLLSGYGMSLSMKRNKPLQACYLFSHLRKLFEPFIFVWIVYLLCFIFIDRGQLSTHCCFVYSLFSPIQTCYIRHNKDSGSFCSCISILPDISSVRFWPLVV